MQSVIVILVVIISIAYLANLMIQSLNPPKSKKGPGGCGCGKD